jgi:flagellar motility protein MotE (MotC chaperone)
MLNVIAMALALNFLALAGGVGWLFKSGKIDKGKAHAIKDIVFPPPVPEAPATQPSGPTAATQPFLKLDELLAKHSGRRAGEQADVIQTTIDAQAAQLDRRKRELDDLQSQVASEQEQLARKNEAVEAERRRLAEEQKLIQDSAGDKGFDDSLKLYSSLQGKQVKQIFMGLPDDIVVRYLQAMQPRVATKVIKEFKTVDEMQKINRLLERMRQGQIPQPTTRPGASPKDNPEAATTNEPKI